jgi:hypothetical protein
LLHRIQAVSSVIHNTEFPVFSTHHSSLSGFLHHPDDFQSRWHHFIQMVQSKVMIVQRDFLRFLQQTSRLLSLPYAVLSTPA